MNSFHKQFALVTGGSTGIGFAIAKQFVLRGGSVAILARRPETLAFARAELENHKVHAQQKVLTLQADVTQKADLEKSLRGLVETHGLPDYVFNSAGVAHPGLFEDLGDDIFHWMMDVNYFGIVNVLKPLVPLMRQRGSGVIVNISSVAGFIGVYGYTAYGASKFALRGFSDALRAELKPHGIQVSVVFPPDTDTPQLSYESRYKPAVTKEIAGSAKLMSADEVAAQTLKAVAKGRYIILPGGESKLFYFLHHFAGHLLYPVMDMMVNAALRKTQKPG